MVDITKTKLIVRRGHSSELPGLPKKQQPAQWTPALDQGELAFAEDTSEIFIGQDPASNDKYKNRLEYPYRNVEIIGENSVNGFSRIHGETMRNGSSADYYSGPMFVTGTPVEEQIAHSAIVEQMSGYHKDGSESNTPYIETEGSDAIRDASATMTTLVANGDGSLTSPTRKLLVVDFSRNRMVLSAHGTDGVSVVHTIEVRDSYGTMISSFAVNSLSNGDPVFVPTSFLNTGNLVGVVTHESGVKTVGIYSPSGHPLVMSQITDGRHDSSSNTTQLTDEVSVSGTVALVHGVNTIGGTEYLYFGNMLSVAANGSYIFVAAHSRYFVLDANGSFLHSVEMPFDRHGTPVKYWTVLGAKMGALHEGGTHQSAIDPVTGLQGNHALAASIALSLFGGYPSSSIVIDYVAQTDHGSHYVFAHVPVSSPVAGKVSGFQALGAQVRQTSAVVPDISPTDVNDQMWRSPKAGLAVASDRIANYRMTWFSDFGFHEFKDGNVTTAKWSETDISDPQLMVSVYDSASNRTVGWNANGDTVQLEVANNSIPADDEYQVEMHGDSHYLGGDEDGSAILPISSIDGSFQYIANISAKRYIGVYDRLTGRCIASIDLLKSTENIAGGSVVQCGDNRIAIPLQTGNLFVLTVNSYGEVDWHVRNAIAASGGNYGERGIYFYSLATDSLVTIWGPTDSNTGRNSYAYSLTSNTIAWNAIINGANDFTCVTSYPVSGNYFGFVDRTGYAVVVNLLNGTTPYRGLADGAGLIAPPSTGSWAWDSATMTFVYVNTTGQFTNQPAGGYIGGFVATSTDPYHNGGENAYVDLIKVSFAQNGAGDWSSHTTRPLKNPRHEFLPPEKSMWADWENGFIYVVSNGSIKAYNSQTLQLEARADKQYGGSFMKLTGFDGELHFQSGNHYGANATPHTHGASYFDEADIHRGRLGSLRLYAPIESISLFGITTDTTTPWRTLLIDGDPERPYQFYDITALNAFVDYAVYDKNGRVLREGQHQVQYYHNPVSVEGEIAGDAYPEFSDMAITSRSSGAPLLPRATPQPSDAPPVGSNVPTYQYDERYAPSRNIIDVQFRYVVVELPTGPVVRIQYRNRTGDDAAMRWKVSRPDIAVPVQSQRGSISKSILLASTMLGECAPPEAPPMMRMIFEERNVDSFHLPEYDLQRYNLPPEDERALFTTEVADLLDDAIFEEFLTTIGAFGTKMTMSEYNDVVDDEYLRDDYMEWYPTTQDYWNDTLDSALFYIYDGFGNLLNDDSAIMALLDTYNKEDRRLAHDINFRMWAFEVYLNDAIGDVFQAERVPLPYMSRLAMVQMFSGEPPHEGLLSIFRIRANTITVPNNVSRFLGEDPDSGFRGENPR